MALLRLFRGAVSMTSSPTWPRWHGSLSGGYLCGRFGFVSSCGPSLEQDCGRYTGAVAHHFDEFDKRDFALSVAQELGISLGSCAAIGDSRSDLPLFQVVDLSIGFNASAHVRAVADVSVEGADLRRVLPILNEWLSSAQV